MELTRAQKRQAENDDEKSKKEMRIRAAMGKKYTPPIYIPNR